LGASGRVPRTAVTPKILADVGLQQPLLSACPGAPGRVAQTAAVRKPAGPLPLTSPTRLPRRLSLAKAPAFSRWEENFAGRNALMGEM